jgi:hypothetical protein
MLEKNFLDTLKVLKKTTGFALALSIGVTIALILCAEFGYVLKEYLVYITVPALIIMTICGIFNWMILWASTYRDGSEWSRIWKAADDEEKHKKNTDAWLKAIEKKSIFMYHIPETNDVIAFEVKDERTVDAIVYPIRKHRGDRFIVNSHYRCSARIILNDDQNIISEIAEADGLPEDIYEEFVDYISDDEIINPDEGRLALIPLNAKNIAFREVK